MALIQYGGGSGGGGGGTITGSGTLNTIVRFTGATSIGDSAMTTDGTNVLLVGGGGIAFGGNTASDAKLLKSGAFSGLGVDVQLGDSSGYASLRALGFMIAAVNPPEMVLSTSARGVAFMESGTPTDIEVGAVNKLAVSGANGGTMTLYDDTAVTGASKLVIAPGAGQTGASTLLDATGLSGAGVGGVVKVSTLADPYGDWWRLGDTGLRFGNGTSGIAWTGSGGYTSPTVGLNYASAGVLKVTDGSSGSGSLDVGVSIQGWQTKTLTESAATGFVDIALAQNTVIGGYVEYVVRTTNGTDYSVESGQLFFTGASKTNGTVDDADVGAVGVPIQSTTTANVWTNTFTVTKGTNKITLECNSVSSLSGTDTITIFYRVHLNGAQTETITGL